MSRIRARDTGPEVLLRKALWAQGLRGYRTHARNVPGCPDICWQSRRIAVFVDGAFWHGHSSAYKPGKSGDYWDTKIARNVARDRAADDRLQAQGWTVLRFWDFDVRKNLGNCVTAVADALQARTPR